MKSVNYLPNALTKWKAKKMMDLPAYEDSNMNVGFVTQSKELLIPGFDKILWQNSGTSSRNVSVQEGKAADEMMLIGSGREGPIAQTLFNFILEDMRSGPTSVRIPVSY
uniref:Uncharacterized protein n=1 Tax=Oryza barthii TaxID=65489 RepID=A0A0D3F3H0_9ORYZ